MNRFVLCLSLASLVALGAFSGSAGADEGAPAKPVQASAALSSGEVEFRSAFLDKDGKHLHIAMLSSLANKTEWDKVEPGETQLVLMVRSSAATGEIAVGSMERDDWKLLFRSNPEGLEKTVGALLYTNSSDEQARVKTMLEEQGLKNGLHGATGGSLELLPEHTLGTRLWANFKLTFGVTKASGKIRIGE